MKKFNLNPFRKGILLQMVLFLPILFLIDPNFFNTCCVLITVCICLCIKHLYSIDLNQNEIVYSNRYSSSSLTDGFMGLGCLAARQRIYGF
jgi:hypothetical protein